MADTFFYSPGIRVSQQLPEQESQHCVKVLRMKEGDKLTVTDGKGFFYPCTLLQAHPKHCIVSIDEEIPRPKSWDFTLHIAFAPTKNIDRIEWFAEKATELGVDRIVSRLFYIFPVGGADINCIHNHLLIYCSSQSIKRLDNLVAWRDQSIRYGVEGQP
jgi:hypothetical protein